MSNSSTEIFLKDTVFLRLNVKSIGVWRKGNIDEIETSASRQRMKLSKQIIDCKEVSELLAVPRLLKCWLDNRTIPCPYGKSMHIVPLSILEDVDEHLKKTEALYTEKLENFISVYDKVITEASETLKNQFSIQDYQTEEELRQRVRITWEYIPVGVVPDTLRAISPGIYEEQKKKYEKLFDELYENTRGFLREQILELTEKLVTQLNSGEDGKRSRLCSSTFTAMSEFLESFSIRNITSDKELEDIVEKAKLVMQGAELPLLRAKETAYRSNIKNRLQQVLDQLKRPEFIESIGDRKYEWD